MIGPTWRPLLLCWASHPGKQRRTVTYMKTRHTYAYQILKAQIPCVDLYQKVWDWMSGSQRRVILPGKTFSNVWRLGGCHSQRKSAAVLRGQHLLLNWGGARGCPHSEGLPGPQMAICSGWETPDWRHTGACKSITLEDFLKTPSWDFPGAPVVELCVFTAVGRDSVPCQETKILSGAWNRKKKKTKNPQHLNYPHSVSLAVVTSFSTTPIFKLPHPSSHKIHTSFSSLEQFSYSLFFFLSPVSLASFRIIFACHSAGQMSFSKICSS